MPIGRQGGQVRQALITQALQGHEVVSPPFTLNKTGTFDFAFPSSNFEADATATITFILEASDGLGGWSMVRSAVFNGPRPLRDGVQMPPAGMRLTGTLSGTYRVRAIPNRLLDFGVDMGAS